MNAATTPAEGSQLVSPQPLTARYYDDKYNKWVSNGTARADPDQTNIYKFDGASGQMYPQIRPKLPFSGLRQPGTIRED
jgi:hypothetical protein